LQHEWAGGSQLNSHKGVQINAMNIRRLARACIVEKKFDRAIELCKTGLRKLDGIVPERDNVQFTMLQATLWLTCGDALHWLGRLEEAVIALEHSVQLAGISGVPGASLSGLSFIIREELALVYTELAQYDKALEIQLPLLNSLRGFYKAHKSDDGDDPRIFSRILVNTAICEYRQALSLSRRVPETVLIHITESLDISRDLYTRYPDTYGFAFADSLRTQAAVLNAAGFKVEALKGSREAISLLRTVLSSDVYRHTPNDLSNPLIISDYLLPLWLYNHMKFSMDTGHTDEALTAGQEAVTLLRPMHAAAATAAAGSSEFVSGTGSIHKPFGMALYYLGVHMRSAGRSSSDFIALWREALQVFRLLVQNEPGSHQEDLARVLYDLGISVEVLVERLDLLSECVELTRAVHATHPSHGSRDVLISRLNEYAIVADSIKDWHTACLAEREIIEHLAVPSRDQSDGHRQDYAGITMSLGKHLLLSGEAVHSLEAFEDAARRWQTLYTSNPAAYHQTYADLAQCARVNATVLKSSGYCLEALRSFDLAVGIWMEIGKTRSGTHLADIAEAAEQVGQIAEHFSNTCRPVEALRASEDAARIRKSLQVVEPSACPFLSPHLVPCPTQLKLL
jgi:tetratricopeptide (TPR) repeat protein